MNLYKHLIILFLALANIQTSWAQVSSYTSAQEYTKPQLSEENSWSMVLIPDPQSYVKFTRNQGTLELMTAWISENIQPLQIELVMCTGDLVEHNDWLNPDGTQANQAGIQQWQAVSRAFERLDGRVPYVAATGNHDYGIKNIEYRRTNYDKYFPVTKNPLSQRLIKDVGSDAQSYPSMINATYEFTSPHGDNFLVLVLEFAPRDEAIEWAKNVIEQDKYKDHRVILLTHSYLNSQSEHIVKENYPIEDGNYGQAIFEKLVKPSTNIEMVFSGHIGSPNDFEKHVGFRRDKNAAGKTVNQMVFNAQALGGGWHGNGGDGWLRWLEFMPDKKTVKVKTFSPLFAISPATQHLAWEKSDYNEFEFVMDSRE